MKTSNCIKAALAGMLMLAGVPAYAIGTASGTSVPNQAFVDYSVGGVAQPQRQSNIDTFLVDNKIDVIVAEVGGLYTDVAPGSVGQILTFTVDNDGNTIQDYALVATNTTDPFGGTDDFDPTNFQVIVDTNANGTLDPGVDFTDANSNGLYDFGEAVTRDFIDELAADGVRTVFIASAIPLGQANDFTAGMTLTATTRNAGTAGTLGALTTETTVAETQGAVDVVFGDAATGDGDSAARDGIGADRDAYRIRTATLTVSKSSRVVSDPFNGTTTPKRIPGAVVEYCIEVANATGGATATNVVVTDDIAGDPVVFTANAYAAGSSLMNGSTSCALSNGTAQSNAVDADAASITGTIATSNLGSIAAGATSRFQFRVTIN